MLSAWLFMILAEGACGLSALRSGLVLQLDLAAGQVRHAPHGYFALVRLRELWSGFLDLARQPVPGERGVGDEPRRFGVADQIDALDAIRGPLRLVALQLPIQRI